MSTLASPKHSSRIIRTTKGLGSTRSSRRSNTGMPRAGMGYCMNMRGSIFIHFGIFLLIKTITTSRRKLTNYLSADLSTPVTSGCSSRPFSTALNHPCTTTSWTASSRITPPNKAERHSGAPQLSKGKWIVLWTSATESRAYKGHLCHLTNSILFSHQFCFRIPPSNLKCIFSRPRFLSFVSLSEFPISKNMPIPLFFRVPPAASRRDPQTHITKVRRSHDRHSPLLTPTSPASLYDLPSPRLLSPATLSCQIPSTTTTHLTTVTRYYDSRNGTKRHLPDFLPRDILIQTIHIAHHPSSTP